MHIDDEDGLYTYEMLTNHTYIWRDGSWLILMSTPFAISFLPLHDKSSKSKTLCKVQPQVSIPVRHSQHACNCMNATAYIVWHHIHTSSLPAFHGYYKGFLMWHATWMTCWSQESLKIIALPHLEDVLLQLQENGVRLHQSKCRFFQPSEEYLCPCLMQFGSSTYFWLGQNYCWSTSTQEYDGVALIPLTSELLQQVCSKLCNSPSAESGSRSGNVPLTMLRTDLWQLLSLIILILNCPFIWKEMHQSTGL